MAAQLCIMLVGTDEAHASMWTLDANPANFHSLLTATVNYHYSFLTDAQLWLAQW